MNGCSFAALAAAFSAGVLVMWLADFMDRTK